MRESKKLFILKKAKIHGGSHQIQYGISCAYELWGGLEDVSLGGNFSLAL